MSRARVRDAARADIRNDAGLLGHVSTTVVYTRSHLRGRRACAAPSIGCERVAFGLAAKKQRPTAREAGSVERREIVAAQ
jgi:hypothetical protein